MSESHTSTSSDPPPAASSSATSSHQTPQGAPVSTADALPDPTKKLSVDEYDRLSPQQQRAYDEARARLEAQQQAELPYTWTQQLDHVELNFPLPESTRARDLEVSLGPTRLVVRPKRPAAAAPLLEGDLFERIRHDESTWSVVDGSTTTTNTTPPSSSSTTPVLCLHLEKMAETHWWPHVLTHHPKIDTTKIVPTESKLSDLDGETRAMVEKMMYDNRAKALGQPTSDQKKQQEILANFQKQHPEMDFSQAKIS